MFLPTMKTLILGATKGLGFSLLQGCLKRGDQIHAIGRSIGTLSKIEKCHPLFCDLTDYQSVKNLVGAIHKNDFDNFFWVAGTLLKGDFSKFSEQEILSTIDTNFRHPVLVAHEIWKMFEKATTKKHFVVISSSSGITPRNDEAIYVATKHAQVGFTRSLGLENKNKDVFVSLISPGGMKTPFWDSYREFASDEFLDPDKVANHILKNLEKVDKNYFELTIPRGSL